MVNNNKQAELNSTEEVNFQMRTSFSWDRAFFTSDGFLGAEELSSMIEGGGDDVKHELQKLEEIESMEAKLFQEMEVSTQKSTKTSKITNSSISLSSGKRDPQAKKVTGQKDAPIKTPPRRSSPVSGGSPGKNVKTVSRRSTSSKTGKGNADSPSKTPPTTRNKEVSVNSRVSRTSPASPVSPGSPGSSSSAFAVNQRSKTSGSVPRRSSVGNVKPSATIARRSSDWKSSKPAVSLMPKTQSCISLIIKPPPVISHPSSPSRQSESSSSSTCTVDQKSKSRGIKGSSTVNHISKSTSKNHHTGQTSDPNAKQSPTTCKTSSPNGSKTVAAVNKGLKPISVKATKPKKQSRETENIFVISPELLDLKGKINALKMEICMQKKDRCNRMAARAAGHEGNLKTPFAMEACSL